MTENDPAIDPEIKDQSENPEIKQESNYDNVDNVNITEGENEPEEEVFGVVDPNAIISAVSVVGKRGRKTNSANDGSDSDEAYFEDDGGDDDDESGRE